MGREPTVQLDAELVEYAGKVLAALREIPHSENDKYFSVVRVSFGFEGEEIPELVLEENNYGELRACVYDTPSI